MFATQPPRIQPARSMSLLSSQFSSVGFAFPAFLLCLLGSLWLLGRFAGTKGKRVEKGRGATLAALYLLMYLAFAGPLLFTILVLGLIGLIGIQEWRRATRSTTVTWTVSGGLLIACGVASLLLLRLQEHGAALCLFAFFMINLTDTAAYFCGRLFGKHKLAPRISPGKTIEGSIGAVLCAVPIAFLFRALLPLPFSADETFGYAIFFAVAAQAGDLVASLAKRRLGIKDYGTLLPGHGGVLDRFDSSLFSAPLFWLLLAL